MTDSEILPTCLTLSEQMNGVNSIHFDETYNEFFVIGDFDEIALTTLSGQLITIQILPDDTKVIAQQRTPLGWQFICCKDTFLTNCILSKDNIINITLKAPIEKARTAAWSPCGQYVAIGSEGTTISVWDTRTGIRTMHKSFKWNDDAKFIPPPDTFSYKLEQNGQRDNNLS